MSQPSFPVGTLLYKDDYWVMPRLEAHAVLRLKQLFPRIPKHQAPPYIFQDTLETATDLLWFESRYPLEMSPLDRATLEAMAKRHDDKRHILENIITGGYTLRDIVGFKDDKAPHSFQKLAIDMTIMSGGLLDVLYMGGGKTVEGIGLCLCDGALPAAIVVESGTMQEQWRKKFEEFSNLRVHVVTQATPYKDKNGVVKIPDADVYIFRYTQISGWADIFETMGFKAVAYDEIQNLRTGTDSAKGLGALRLSLQCRYKLGLSASPIFNYGTEIWNIMQYLRPELLASWEDFKREWAPHGKVEHPEALSSYLKSEHAMIVRSKRDVGKEEVKPNKIIQSVDFDESVIKDADALAMELSKRFEHSTFNEKGQIAREIDMRLRQQTGIAKAKAVAQFVRILIESGEKVLVGLWHRPVYDIFLKELSDLKIGMYTGSESIKQKNNAKEDFIDGKLDALLISLRSGAGLDGFEKVCSTVVIGELDWSNKVMDQLIGRVDRGDQPNPVTAFYCVIDEGSDPAILEINGLKAYQQHGVINGDVAPEPTYSDVSRTKLLIDKYLAKRKPEHAHQSRIEDRTEETQVAIAV